MSRSELSKAIRQHDVETVESLLETDQSLVNQKSDESLAPIEQCLSPGRHRGGYDKRCEILGNLVNHGADVNTPCQNGDDEDDGSATRDWTPMMLALQGKCLTCLQVLIENGADLNISANDGKTAMMLAIEYEYNTCARFLIQHASPQLLNHRDTSGWNALTWTMMCEEPESATSLCKQLVEDGADVNLTSEGSGTALTCAIEHKHDLCASYLIKRATPALINHKDGGGRTALMYASGREGSIASCLCQELLEAGADINIAATDGTTALMNAMDNKMCASLLIEHATPAWINHRDTHGMTAFEWAVEFHRENAKIPNSLCLQLLEAGADVNIIDNDGKTVLEVAAESGHEDVVSLLLEREASVNTVSNNGKTPLYQTVFHFLDASLMNQLFNNGADPTLSITHEVLLHRAVEENNAAKLRTLVMNGFPPQDCTLPKPDLIWLTNQTELLLDMSDWPMSPLALALLRAHPVIARYLIANKFFTRSDLKGNLRRKDLRELVENY